MKTVKTLLSSVIALTLSTASTAALADDKSIVESVKNDMRALEEPESERLDIDELVAADVAASADKPLDLRKSKPLELAPESTSTGSMWWKLLLSAGIIGGGMWLGRKRFAKRAKPEKVPMLDVLTRKSVGVRSELCIVNVDGHRLLLGITPNSIQRLAALPDPDDAVTLAEAEAEPGFGDALKGAVARMAQLVDDETVARSRTLHASTLETSVPPPESSQTRIIVRDTSSSKTAKRLDLDDLAGAQARSLESLRAS